MLFCDFRSRSILDDDKILTYPWDRMANWESNVQVIGIEEVNELKIQ